MKAHLRVSEAARLAGVSPSTLRAWEAAGLIAPSRDGRNRWLSPRDVEDLQRIAVLRRRGFSVAAIRGMLSVAAGWAPTGATQAGPAPAGPPPPGPLLPGPLPPGPLPPGPLPPGPLPPGGSLGERLRAERLRRGLSLREASHLAGLSVSHLSAIECGTRNVSLAGLQRLAVALCIGVADLFDSAGPSGTGRRLIRAGERPVLQTGDRRVRIESLASGAQLLEPHLYLIEPGGGSEGSYHHDGEEMVFVLAGEAEFWLNEVERHVIRVGDCLTFPSSLRHRWRNPGPDRLEMLWINTPITF